MAAAMQSQEALAAQPPMTQPNRGERRERMDEDEDDGADDYFYCPDCGDPREACLCSADPWDGQLESED
jgi:hypothetical protein